MTSLSAKALALLAEHPDGCDRGSMLAHGFSIPVLNRLVRIGLAIWLIRRGKDNAIDSICLKITKAGRQSLTKQSAPPAKLPNNHRHALSLLANSVNGHTEPMLLARGVSNEFLTELIRDGLATADTEHSDRSHSAEVTRVKITDRGRRALR